LPTPPGRYNCVIGNEKKERIPAPSPSIDERTIAAMPKIKKIPCVHQVHKHQIGFRYLLPRLVRKQHGAFVGEDRGFSSPLGQDHLGSHTYITRQTERKREIKREREGDRFMLSDPAMAELRWTVKMRYCNVYIQ